MSTDPQAHDSTEVSVVRQAGLSDLTGQTEGALRLVGVNPGPDGLSSRLWFGRVENKPGMRSVPHHHGEAETGGYVLQGTARIYWGPGYEQYVDVHEGDFCYVPPHLPHIEANLSETEPLVFLTCRTPDNIVVNLEDVDVVAED